MTNEEIRRHIELMRSIDKPTIDLPLATVERLMATKTIGKVDTAALAKGKVKPKAPHMSVPKKIAAKAKADRKEAGLRANRKGKA